MEVIVGIGPLPSGWSTHTGAEITELIGKGASPRWQGFAYSNHGMLFVTSENVRDGYLDVSSPKFLPLAFHEKLSRTKLRRNDILVNLVGASIGRSCRVKTDLDPANVNQAVAVFRLRDPNSAPYVEYFFQSPTTIKRILEMQADAARPNISLGNLRQFVLVLPPPEEQRAIAGALSDVDALIGALDQLIAKKADLKQAAMQQLLTGQTRLPGFHGDWEEQPLASAIAGLDTGVSVNSVEDELDVDSYEFAVLKTSAVENGCFLPAECKKIAPKDLHRVKLNPLAESILISRMNTIDLVGECGYVGADHPGLFVPDRLWMTRFHPESRLSARWLSYVLSSSEYRRRLRSIATGTSGSMKNIAKGTFLSLRLRFPSPEEQTAIAEVLSDMDAELAALEQRRDKTRALKQGMMQELLTGRTRLV